VAYQPLWKRAEDWQSGGASYTRPRIDMSQTTAAKRARFQDLHRQDGCFVIPNPWDLGSARYLQSLGFKALATTSAGYGWSRGQPDGGLGRDAILANAAELAAGVDVPVSADFENGYADNHEALAENVARLCRTGVAGLSLEDTVNRKVYDFAESVARVKTARSAIDAAGGNVVFTARADALFLGSADFDDAVKRLVAFAEAGADCLYAPGLKTPEQVTAVVRAVAPKPVNVLVTAPGFTVAQLTELGVRRISVGGALARTAWGGFMAAAREIAEAGSFTSFGQAPTGAVLNATLRET
jgi:2-methylisocitrate lyase-like PEP mutase family enzyme